MGDAGHSARKRSHSKKVSRSLIALSSAAVLGVYSAGYMRTRAAAERFLEEPVWRRPVAPVAIVGDASAGVAPATPVVPAAPDLPEPIDAPLAPPPAPTSATTPSAASPEPKSRAAEPKSAVVESTASAAPAPVPAPLAAVATATPLGLAAVQQTLGALPAGLVAPPSAKAKYMDGTYTGWGTCRHGDIQAKVVIADGKIASAGISQCLTRYSCSWISPLPPQVITRQSPETDFVSGATDSTNAYYFAVVEALSQAKPK